jgi:hypothetical protein
VLIRRVTPRLSEKSTPERGKSREIPVPHDLKGCILAYVEAAGIVGEEGFTAVPGR